MQFYDARRHLPRHATKRWSRRRLEAILGAAVHHTAGGDDPHETAEYHVAGNHVSADGMPALAYTFFITGVGTVVWANDLEARTWSQGGRSNPDVDGDGDVDADDGAGNSNGRFLAIVLGGSFDGDTNQTGQEPTFAQVLALLSLWGHLVGHVNVNGWPPELFGALKHLSLDAIWTHADFGKSACPGRTLTSMIGACRTNRAFAFKSRTVDEWQEALREWGCDLGDTGPRGDGVDGSWGPLSRRALVEFQRSHGLEMTGHRDAQTAVELFK